MEIAFTAPTWLLVALVVYVAGFATVCLMGTYAYFKGEVHLPVGVTPMHYVSEVLGFALLWFVFIFFAWSE